jgi:hypothetical protein
LFSCWVFFSPKRKLRHLGFWWFALLRFPSSPLLLLSFLLGQFS